MKRCSRCKETKGYEAFNVCSDKPDGYNHYCKVCAREVAALWYEKNKERKRAKEFERYSETWKFIIAYLKKHPCVKCGEKDPLVLEFDHIDRTTKEFDIGRAIRFSYTLEDIKKEMRKCQVLCTNCHRRKTATEAKWPRARLIREMT